MRKSVQNLMTLYPPTRDVSCLQIFYYIQKQIIYLPLSLSLARSLPCMSLKQIYAGILVRLIPIKLDTVTKSLYCEWRVLRRGHIGKKAERSIDWQEVVKYSNFYSSSFYIYNRRRYGESVRLGF